MEPTKRTRAVSNQTVATANKTTAALKPLPPKGLTRRTTSNVPDENCDIMQTRGKRNAEHSPQKNEKVKRSALANLKNNLNNYNQQLTKVHQNDDTKKNLAKEKVLVQSIYSSSSVQGKNGPALQVFKDQENLMMQKAYELQHKAEQHKAQQANESQPKAQPMHMLTRAASKMASLQKENQTIINITSKTYDDQNQIKTKTTKDVVRAATLAPSQHPQVQKLGTKRHISNEFNKTKDSLYVSALKNISSSDSAARFSGKIDVEKNAVLFKQEALEEPEEAKDARDSINVPDGVEDFDKLNWNDPFQVSHYAVDIFNYLKERESKFQIDDYMDSQIHLSKWMRSLLVDWMVEVQEAFELNPETLYLAVKIVDRFLCKQMITNDKLQLLGVVALFIACKFDERSTPFIQDFLYICEGAYNHDELLHWEMAILKTIKFDLGIPLSYRFLRRYARCSKVPMTTLTLARYILELSLMDYECIFYRDSKMACATLFMALRLHGDEKPWTPTLIHYTGYKLPDFADIVPVLNIGLHCPNTETKSIRMKYSCTIFYEVAKVPLMTTDKLFENQLDN